MKEEEEEEEEEEFLYFPYVIYIKFHLKNPRKFSFFYIQILGELRLTNLHIYISPPRVQLSSYRELHDLIFTK